MQKLNVKFVKKKKSKMLRVLWRITPWVYFKQNSERCYGVILSALRMYKQIYGLVRRGAESPTRANKVKLRSTAQRIIKIISVPQSSTTNPRQSKINLLTISVIGIGGLID